MAFKFPAEDQHVCQKVTEGLLAGADVYRFFQQDASAIIAQGWAKSFGRELFQLHIFFFRQADGQPFGPYGPFLLFHRERFYTPLVLGMCSLA